jgi:hypothetical protein
LIAAKKEEAIFCRFNLGPRFCDSDVSDECNANTHSATSRFGSRYTNDARLVGKTFFTGSLSFQVEEIEVFEITD